METILLTEDQIALQEMIHDFADREIMPATIEADRTGIFPAELVAKATKMGLTMLTMPERYGGMDADYVTLAIAREEMARGDVGFNATIGACTLATLPAKIAGTEYHMDKIADVLLGGGLTAFALTEPQAGSDAGGMLSTAVKKGDEYVLNGRKCFITNGGKAGLYTVFANADKSKGLKGITAFLVEAGTPGLSIGAEENKMGAKCSSTTDLILEDVVVPKENMLGAEGEGFKIAMKTLGKARCSAGAGAIGNARFALEYAMKYATERRTFGKPICEHQAIGHMLADMYMNLEAARQFTHYACRLVDHGVINAAVSSGSKAFATDMGMRVTTDAVQIVGGYGYSKDYPLEKRMRDAKILQIWEGTNQIQRNIVAGALIKTVK